MKPGKLTPAILRHLTLLATIFVTVITASAHTLRGTVVTSDNEPLAGASVVLFASGNDSVAITGTSSNEQGAYSLQAESGQYRMRASFIGMKTVWRDVSLSQDTRLDNIVMLTDTLLAHEVTVTARFIEHKADRFIVQIAGNPLARSANGMDMLYRIPGTWGLSVYGRPISKVFINGRELRIPMEQISGYLKSINAEDITSYEIIPLAGSEYSGSAGGSAILRIKLKKAPKDGAMITLGLQLNDKAEQAPGTGASLFAAASVGKLQSYTIFKFSNLPKDFNRSENTRTYHDSKRIIEDSYYNHWHNAYTIDQSFAYEIDPRNEISANFNMLLNPKDYNESADRMTLNETDIINPDSIISNGYETFQDYAAGLYYEHKWDTLGSYVKASLEYLYNNASRTNDTRYYYADNIPTIGFSLWESRKGQALNPFVDVHIATRKGLSVNTGASYIRSWQNNGFIQSATNSDAFSNPNKYNEDIYAAYANVNGQWKIIQYVAGLRVEHRTGQYFFGEENRSSLQHETSILPSASLSITENRKKNIRSTVSYATSIQRPRSYQFDPLTRQTGEYSYMVGNDKLRSAYIHNLMASQSLPLGFRITAIATWCENPINYITRIGDDGLTAYHRYENDGKSSSYRLNLQWTKWLTSFWYLNIQAQGGYSIEESNAYGRITNLAGSVGAYTYFQLPYEWYIDLQGDFRSPTRRLELYIPSSYSVSGSIVKTFLDQSLILRLDVLYAIAPYTQSYRYYNLYDSYSRSLTHMRTFQFSINYRFNVGKKDVKASRIRNQGDAYDRIAPGI